MKEPENLNSSRNSRTHQRQRKPADARLRRYQTKLDLENKGFNDHWTSQDMRQNEIVTQILVKLKQN